MTYKPDICPCVDCICIPVCKHKPFSFLFCDCILVDSYAPRYKQRHIRDAEKIMEIQEILKPMRWQWARSAHDNIYVEHNQEGIS